MKTFDVDIDLQPNANKEAYGVRASIYNADREELQPHPSGVYIDTNIPIDGETGLAAIEYESAEDLGFIKIDLLTNTSYSVFSNKEEVIKAGEKEPDWLLLGDKNFVDSLPHISGHFDLIESLSPTSIEDLADAISLLRPGKTHLLDSYMEDKQSTRENLYRKPTGIHKDLYYFKKSHAISYAMMIVCVMNSKDKFSRIRF